MLFLSDLSQILASQKKQTLACNTRYRHCYRQAGTLKKHNCTTRL